MPTVRDFHVVKPLPRFGFGSNPNPELFYQVGTVGNTRRGSVVFDPASQICLSRDIIESPPCLPSMCLPAPVIWTWGLLVAQISLKDGTCISARRV